MKISSFIILLLFLIILVLLMWIKLSHKPCKDAEFEKQQTDSIKVLNLRLSIKDKAIDSITLRQYNDSLVFEARIKAQDTEINRLKTNVKKVNLSHANPATLDSIVNILTR